MHLTLLGSRVLRLATVAVLRPEQRHHLGAGGFQHRMGVRQRARHAGRVRQEAHAAATNPAERQGIPRCDAIEPRRDRGAHASPDSPAKR